MSPGATGDCYRSCCLKIVGIGNIIQFNRERQVFKSFSSLAFARAICGFFVCSTGEVLTDR